MEGRKKRTKHKIPLLSEKKEGVFFYSVNKITIFAVIIVVYFSQNDLSQNI
jgi:hypothetical protein